MPPAKPKLPAKLVAIREKVEAVPKSGYNDHHKYHYRKATDVADAVRAHLNEQGILFYMAVTGRTVREDKVTTVALEFVFTDVDSGEELRIPFAGQGHDTTDKGVWKAYTGAVKYLFTTLFLIPEEADDPEHSSADTAARDDKPPVIPKARATKLRGIASENLAPAIVKAKLAEYDVDRITKLNVAQADSFEEWLSGEIDAKEKQQ